MSILHAGLLGAMLGETPSTKYDVSAAREQSFREYMLGLGNSSYLGTGYYSGPGSPYNALGAMQQYKAMNDPFEYQRQQARGMQAMMPYQSEPPRKKVESKVIETVEIRPEQDVKLLRAGTKL